MGDSTSGEGGNDDLDRVWRRPAPGEPEPSAASSQAFGMAERGSGDDDQRAIWGPQADTGRPTPTEAPPVTAATWHPPASGSPTSVGADPPAAPWQPVVGAPAASDMWGASVGPPVRHDIGVDERPAAPSRPPVDERFAPWWTRGGIAAAVLAVVIAVIAVASGSDPGGEASTATSGPATSSPPTTARPTTTTRPPATTTSAAPTTLPGSSGDVDGADLAPEDDPRVMLTDLPDGFTATGARLMLDNRDGARMSGLLFVNDGSTWFDGPWIQIGPAEDAALLGPTTPIDVGGRSARLGTNQHGAEMVVVDIDGGAVAVSAKGMEPGTAAATAAALTIGGAGAWSVPAAALPPGLQPATGNLGDSLTDRPTSSASVNYSRPGGVRATVYSSLAEPGYDPLSIAPFYLTDLEYVSVGSEPGVMGVYRYASGSAARSVQWRRGGVDIEVTSFGMEAAEMLALAARASTRTDSGWSERQWSAAEAFVSGPDEPEPVMVERALQFGDEGEGTVTVSRFGSGLSWSVAPSTRAGRFFIGRYGQDAAPITLQVATNPVPAIQTDGVAHVVALALGDASIEGATVRLRVGSFVSGTGGSGGETTAGVHPLDVPPDGAAGAPAEFGYTVGAAVAVPWTEGGFVAELIAVDGITVLATATPADLA